MPSNVRIPSTAVTLPQAQANTPGVAADVRPATLHRPSDVDRFGAPSARGSVPPGPARSWAPAVETTQRQHRDNVDALLRLAATSRDARAPLSHRHPLSDDNRIERLVDGAAVFERLSQDVRDAQHVINVVTYQFLGDDTGDAMWQLLIDKARAGLEVNVVLDGLGSLLNKGTDDAIRLRRNIKVLRAAGGQVVITGKSALSQHEHRKIVTIDGRVAYTGGMGFGDNYRHQWHDVMSRYEGTLAQQLQIEALETLLLAGVDLIPPGAPQQWRSRYFPAVTGQAGQQVGRVVRQLPGRAQEIRAGYFDALRALGDGDSIWIENPYVTDLELVKEMCNAAQRGAHVHLIVPQEGNHELVQFMVRGLYRQLLGAGVELYEYPKMTHMKAASSSLGWASEGSYNCDGLSAFHNTETNVELRGDAAEQVRRDLMADMAASQRITDASGMGLKAVAGKLAVTLFGQHL